MKQVISLYVENDVCASFSITRKLEDLIYKRMKYYLFNMMRPVKTY
jgi:hypothetical protein